MRIVIYGFRNSKPITAILTILKISLVLKMILEMILEIPYVRMELSKTGCLDGQNRIAFVMHLCKET